MTGPTSVHCLTNIMRWVKTGVQWYVTIWVDQRSITLSNCHLLSNAYFDQMFAAHTRWPRNRSMRDTITDTDRLNHKVFLCLRSHRHLQTIKSLCVSVIVSSLCGRCLASEQDNSISLTGLFLSRQVPMFILNIYCQKMRVRRTRTIINVLQWSHITGCWTAPTIASCL